MRNRQLAHSILFIIGTVVAMSSGCRASVPTGEETTFCPDSLAETGNGPYEPADVTLAAWPRHRQTARYPRWKKRFGVTGSAMIEYIVNTAGCAEANSRNIISATDSAFAASGWDAIRRTRFRPAQRGTQTVRAIVTQAFVFQKGR